MANLKDKTTTPCYMPYPTLKSTVQTFADSTTPTMLNRFVLSKLSGAAHSALISGLRFLGLANEDESATEDFRNLVNASKKGETEYEMELLKILERVYEPIVQGVDMENGTLPELEAAFKAVGVAHGSMLITSVRFYVKALQDCGSTVSPHITKPRPRQKKAEKQNNKTPKRPKAKNRKPEDEIKDEIPTGFARLPIIGKEGAFIQYRTPLTEHDCDVIEAAVKYLRVLSLSQKEGGNE